MDDLWRINLYPIGFIATFLFSMRFIIQWIVSEKNSKCIVPKAFWQLSLLANIIMSIHTFIQLQYPLCIIQGCNAVIAWRNLNFLQGETKLKTLRFTLHLFIFMIFWITAGFVCQSFFFVDGFIWLRAPVIPWGKQVEGAVPFHWQLLGILGTLIFSLRFWVQWLEIEKKKASILSASFWSWSLLGAILAFVYFLKIRDWVNLIGYGSGLIPYARNLVLIAQFKKISS